MEEGMQFWSVDLRRYEPATACYLSNKPFADSSRMNPVGDHGPITGRFRVATHSQCNVQK